MNSKKNIIIWLKKSRTHIDTVIKMIENDEYCIDVIQQTLAVIWLLKSANTKLLENHLNSCCKTQTTCDKSAEQINKMMDELLKVFKTIQK